jgi:Mn-dependent DtxR family transcriptional regulator
MMTQTRDRQGAKPHHETKLETIERLVKRKRGASEHDLTEATGWKPHSLTGGLSRLRSSGLKVRHEEDPRRGTVFFGERSKEDDTGGHTKH